ncbi:O-antigen ligase family protein [Lacticaseibacillus paracasei]|uniref:O-antigen ligase family protein n=1 Tax=Lacticaseibacillus paracasei TaxID=1597 RepID=UPI0025A21916|nr:O-antigen ligase family protein [Lacticaseibacillus paracasei]MDM7527913.1 O-antigen ligase family protein [Lacticaseibacillus paracasei]
MKSEVRALQGILSVTVVIDAINGLFSNYFPSFFSNIVPMFRACIFAFLLLLLLQLSRRRFVSALTIILAHFLFTVRTLSAASSMTASNLLSEASSDVKVYYFFSLVLVFLSLAERRMIDREWLLGVMNINSVLMPLLFIFPTLLGLSRTTYINSGIGSSGFFIANNSSNVILILSSIFLFYRWRQSYIFKSRISIWWLFLSWIALYIQGSKTSLAFLALEIIFGITLFFFANGLQKWSARWIVIYVVALATVVTSILYALLNMETIRQQVSDALQGLVLRQQALYAISGNSLVDTLMSGRVSHLRMIISGLINGGYHYSILSGYTHVLLPSGYIAEMDLFDIILDGGGLMTLMTFGVTIYLLLRAARKKWIGQTETHIFVMLSLLFLLTYSFFAGHVFSEILASTFVAILLILNLREVALPNEDSCNNSAISAQK